MMSFSLPWCSSSPTALVSFCNVSHTTIYVEFVSASQVVGIDTEFEYR